MENKKRSIIANTIHQEKPLTFEVSHHIAAQVDNKIIHTGIKESAEHQMGCKKKKFRLESS